MSTVARPWSGAEAYGRWRTAHRRRARGACARAGHAIGNHTQGHPRLTDLTRRQVRDQLRWASRAIGPVQGPCMRPPYGLINKEVTRVARAQGLTPVMWTGHIDGWHRHTVKWNVSQLRKYTKPGDIILLHDRNVRTIKAVARTARVARHGLPTRITSRLPAELTSRPLCDLMDTELRRGCDSSRGREAACDGRMEARQLLTCGGDGRECPSAIEATQPFSSIRWHLRLQGW
ncbi:MAG TPA: polysaccharide deacetylase family protein, partial [Dermatophilaceae bacterium]|nr:polysaccharide deacetylase family protein [Dermatophilaceae bacterium]